MTMTVTPGTPSPSASPSLDADGLGIYPNEIISMLRRRWRWLILPTVAGALVGGAAVLLREPAYRSSATLLIDSPQIPTRLVETPLTDVADERIAKIRQQILSRESLSRLIDRNKLYPGAKEEMEFPKLLDLMRQNIGVNLVGANQTTGQNQAPGSTIAFTLSFDYADARTAQAVTAQLAEMFMVEDKRFRTEQATGTAAFLAHSSDQLRRQLRDLAEQRRGIEARYAGALPDDVALSSQSSSALRAEITRTDSETQSLVQQIGLLAARQQEMEQAPPGVEGLTRAEARLASLLATYSEQYPDVIAARAEVVRQRALLQRNPGRSGTLIEAEIAASRERIATLAQRRAELVRSMADLDRRVAQAPQSAFELNTVEREYDNIKRQYDSLREKQLDAQVAANLQSEDKGERFTVVDAPSLPLHPMGSPAWMVLALSIAAGMIMGVSAIILFEFVTGRIHGANSLMRVVRAPVFGTVPTSAAGSGSSWISRILGWLRPAPAFARGAHS